MDNYFSGSRPQLVDDNDIMHILSKFDNPSKQIGYVWYSPFSYIYNDFIVPNIFLLIMLLSFVAFFIYMYKTHKNELQKKREEAEKESDTESEDSYEQESSDDMSSIDTVDLSDVTNADESDQNDFFKTMDASEKIIRDQEQKELSRTRVDQVASLIFPS